MTRGRTSPSRPRSRAIGASARARRVLLEALTLASIAGCAGAPAASPVDSQAQRGEAPPPPESAAARAVAPPAAPEPLEVDHLAGVVQVGVTVAGGLCVRTRDGAVLCAGIAGPGRVPPMDVARQVSLGEPAVDIVVHAGGGCAALESGAVSCWSAALEGAAVPGLDDARQVALAGDFACARRGDGTVRCASHRPGGVSSHSRPRYLGSVTDVAWLMPRSARCVILEDGGSRCEGDARVQAASGLGGLAQIVVGERESYQGGSRALSSDHGCAALRDGRAICWGSNWFGELGDGTRRDSLGRPVQVAGLSNVAELAVGYLHTCARLDSGEVYCWGMAEGGRLGLAPPFPTRRSPPCRLDRRASARARRIWPTLPICVACPPGTLDCVLGRPRCREAGASPPSFEVYDHSVPCVEPTGAGAREPIVPIPTRLGLADVTQIDTAGRFSCAVLASGELRCWGPSAALDLARLGVAWPPP